MARRVEPEGERVANTTVDGSPLPLLSLALIAGLYAIAPGIYLGGLHVKRGAEIVDHVFPGLLVIAMVGVGLLWGARSRTSMAYAGLVVLIAGLFMVLAHIGLLRQAIKHEVAWGGAAYHCSAAALVFLVGLAWVWRYRGGFSN